MLFLCLLIQKIQWSLTGESPNSRAASAFSQREKGRKKPGPVEGACLQELCSSCLCSVLLSLAGLPRVQSLAYGLQSSALSSASNCLKTLPLEPSLAKVQKMD